MPRTMPPSDHSLDSASSASPSMILLVILIVAFAPWPRGSVDPTWALLPELVAAGLLIWLAVQPKRLGPAPLRTERLLGACLALLIGVGAFQLLPLGQLCGVLSPASIAARTPFVPQGFDAPTTLSLYPYKTRLALNAWGAAAAILVLMRSSSSRQGRTVLLCLALAATLQATVGVVLHLGGGSLPWVTATPHRAQGSYPNPNHFAGLLALSFPLCLGLAGVGAAASRRSGRALLWLIPAGVLAIGVLFSGSRGAALAMLVGVATYALVVAPDNRRKLKHLLIGSLVSLMALGLAVGVSPLASRVAQMGEGAQVSRFRFWRIALEILRDYPLFGAGLRSHEQLTPTRFEGADLLNATHNDFLNLLADMGLVGGGLCAIAFLAFFLSLRKRHAQLKPGPERLRFAASVAAATTLLFSALFEFNLQISANLWAFAMVAGYALRRDPGGSRPYSWPLALRIALALGGVALAHSATRLGAGEILLHRGQDASLTAEQREEALEAAGTWNPGLAQVPHLQGSARFSRDKFDEAQASFALACSLEPRGALHHLQLARALLSAGHWPEGEAELNRAQALAPHFPSRLRWIALIRLRLHVRKPTMERLESALGAFRELLRWSPGSLRLVFSALTRELQTLHPHQFELLLPPDQDDLRRLAVRLLVKSKRPKVALEVLRRLVECPEPSGEDLEFWAELHLDLFDPFTAKSVYLRAVALLDPSERGPSARRAWNQLHRRGYSALGLSLLKRLAATHPDDSGIQLVYGESLLKSGRPESAVLPLGRAADLGSAESRVALGHAQLALGRSSAAIASWSQALRTLQSVSARSSLSLELGNLLRERGDWEAARRVVGLALRQDPQNAALRSEWNRLRRQDSD
jgi:tetratricopeptide (TPR) repeat protein/O-antigen ligase